MGIEPVRMSAGELESDAEIPFAPVSFAQALPN